MRGTRTQWVVVFTVVVLMAAWSRPSQAQSCPGCSVEALADMPTARIAIGAGVGVVDGRIVVIGDHEGNPGSGRINEAYDPSTDSWTVNSPHPRGEGRRNVNQNAVVNGELFLFGGANIYNSFHTQTVDKYDLANDVWTLNVATYPVPLGGASSTVFHDQVFVFGGNAYNGPAYSSAYRFDPVAGTFAPLTPMPTARIQAASFVIDDQIWVAGGFDRNGSTITFLPSIDIYDPATDSWSQGPSMPAANWMNWSGVLDNGEIYAVYSSPNTEVYWYNQAAAEWELICASQVPNSGGFAVVALEERLHFIGGGDPKVATHTAMTPGCVSSSSAEFACVGFQPPLASGQLRLRGNRSVPLKATLLNEFGEEVAFEDVIAPPRVKILFTENPGGPTIDVSSLASPSGQGSPAGEFSFAEHWHYNLSSRNLGASGIYTVSMVSGDPTEYEVVPTCRAELTRR